MLIQVATKVSICIGSFIFLVRGTSSIDCRERGSHVRGVYHTQYTSRMETARVKEDVGADTRIIVKE